MRVKLLKSTLLVLLALVLFAVPALTTTACAGDISTANDLTSQSDSLRVSASDKLRKSTAAIDGLLRSAAAGQALPVAQTKATTDAAVQDLNRAREDLSEKG